MADILTTPPASGSMNWQLIVKSIKFVAHIKNVARWSMNYLDALRWLLMDDTCCTVQILSARWSISRKRVATIATTIRQTSEWNCNQSIDLDKWHIFGFESVMIGQSLGPEIDFEWPRESAPSFGLRHFYSFATERLIRSSYTQKIFDRARQGLSIDVLTIKIKLKMNKVIWENNLKFDSYWN